MSTHVEESNNTASCLRKQKGDTLHNHSPLTFSLCYSTQLSLILVLFIYNRRLNNHIIRRYGTFQLHIIAVSILILALAVLFALYR